MRYTAESGVMHEQRINKKLMVSAAGGLLLALSLALPANADPSEQGQCRQDAHDAMVAASEEGTRGDFMSDTLFGNEPNQEDGRTVPSQSPGPFVNTGPNDPPRNDRTRGFTGGDMQAAIREACQS